MASYTTTLRRLLDPSANTAGYSFTKGHYENGVWVPAEIKKTEFSTNFELWETGDREYPLIFDDPEWEGYDPTFRSHLNSVIVDYYWGYEIGSETPQMFKQRINQKMRLIMPYYNLLFKAQWEQFKDFDPNSFYREKEFLGGTERELGERKEYDHNGNAIYGLNQDGSITNNAKQFNYDTPQNGSVVSTVNGEHMSSASAAENTNGKVYSQNGCYDGVNLTDNYTFKQDKATDKENFKNRKDIEKGYNTSKYTQYKEYLDGLKNIEQMIVDELRDNFMLVY